MKITDFKYIKNQDGYTVTGYKGKFSNIEIPEGVTEIARGAFVWSEIESVMGKFSSANARILGTTPQVERDMWR